MEGQTEILFASKHKVLGCFSVLGADGVLFEFSLKIRVYRIFSTDVHPVFVSRRHGAAHSGEMSSSRSRSRVAGLSSTEQEVQFSQNSVFLSHLVQHMHIPGRFSLA